MTDWIVIYSHLWRLNSSSDVQYNTGNDSTAHRVWGLRELHCVFMRVSTNIDFWQVSEHWVPWSSTNTV